MPVDPEGVAVARRRQFSQSDKRRILAAPDLERYAQEASEFVARGLRLRDEPVH